MISYLCDNGRVNDYLAKNNKADRLEIVGLGYLSRYDIVGFIIIFLQITAIARGLQYLHSQNVIHGDVKAVRTFLAEL
jgi:serine/threonine protein kinase